MDGDPTLVLKPVFKSFTFKTFDDFAIGDAEDFDVVQSSHPDGKWNAAKDFELPELVAFFQDSGYPFVKYIGIDSVVSSNCHLDLDNASDAEVTSESSVESQFSSDLLNSTLSKHISDQLREEDVINKRSFENFPVKDDQNFGEMDQAVDTSCDHTTKTIISETLLQIRQDPTKAVLSDAMLSSTETMCDDRHSNNSFKAALEKARLAEILSQSVECHSWIPSNEGRDVFPLCDASKYEIMDSLTGFSPLKQHCGKYARIKEGFPQSDSSEDCMSLSIKGSSQSQEHCRENAMREVWNVSVEPHLQDLSENGMSDSLTEADQSQQHHPGDSCSSVSGLPLAIHSRAISSFGNISFRSSSTSSSKSFTFPILASEWNDSPVRMAEPDKKQLRKHHRWRIRFLCCAC